MSIKIVSLFIFIAIFHNSYSSDVVYHLMIDRFSKAPSSSSTHRPNYTKEMFLGGNIKGIVNRLDYLQQLGISSVLISPFQKNISSEIDRPENEPYHGYHIIDFTKIDPRFGSPEDLLVLSKECHKRKMKLYFDVVLNHTANVIRYNNQMKPYIPSKFESIKNPSWLNDLSSYHLKGNYYPRPGQERPSKYQYLDLFGLDDLNHSSPTVTKGLINIFADWISKYKFDGIRIDAFSYLNPDFFSKFVTEMKKINPDLVIFTEKSYVDINNKEVTLLDQSLGLIPIDLNLYQVINQIICEPSPHLPELIERLKKAQTQNKLLLVSSHDYGRCLKNADPDGAKKIIAAYALGQALSEKILVYYGDEQGFYSTGPWSDSRQNMFDLFNSPYTSSLSINGKKQTNYFSTESPIYSQLKNIFLNGKNIPIYCKEDINFKDPNLTIKYCDKSSFQLNLNTLEFKFNKSKLK